MTYEETVFEEAIARLKAMVLEHDIDADSVVLVEDAAMAAHGIPYSNVLHAVTVELINPEDFVKLAKAYSSYYKQYRSATHGTLNLRTIDATHVKFRMWGGHQSNGNYQGFKVWDPKVLLEQKKDLCASVSSIDYTGVRSIIEWLAARGMLQTYADTY